MNIIYKYEDILQLIQVSLSRNMTLSFVTFVMLR